jgi:hypothetical protein
MITMPSKQNVIAGGTVAILLLTIALLCLSWYDIAKCFYLECSHESLTSINKGISLDDDDDIINNNTTAPIPMECIGKEHLLSLVKAAGLDSSVSLASICNSLPYWPNYTALYGDKPVIIGLERCAEYRQFLASTSMPPAVRVGGLYNSGTNALALQLERNVEPLGGLIQHNAPWSKHGVAARWMDFRSTSVDYKAILPLIIVREPLLWMQSMVSQILPVYYSRVFYIILVRIGMN